MPGLFSRRDCSAAITAPECQMPAKHELLDFDCRACVGELLLDRLRLFLGHALFHVLGGAIHQVLGFFQAQAGDFTYRLDHIDLVGAGAGQDDGEFGLLFSRCRLLPLPPPAIITGAAAAAETPRRSSSFFTSWAASSRLSPTIVLPTAADLPCCISTLISVLC